MKLRVDPEICAGFRVCIGVCAEAFYINDDGYAEVLTAEVPAEYRDLVRTAADQCPSGAIFIEGGAA